MSRLGRTPDCLQQSYVEGPSVHISSFTLLIFIALFIDPAFGTGSVLLETVCTPALQLKCFSAYDVSLQTVSEMHPRRTSDLTVQPSGDKNVA